MSDDAENLKTKLADTGSLTDEEIHAAGLSDNQEIATLEQYIAANKMPNHVTH